MLTCLCVLVFYNSEARYAFHYISKVRRDSGGFGGRAISGEGLVFYATASEDTVCARVRG